MQLPDHSILRAGIDCGLIAAESTVDARKRRIQIDAKGQATQIAGAKNRPNGNAVLPVTRFPRSARINTHHRKRRERCDFDREHNRPESEPEAG